MDPVFFIKSTKIGVFYHYGYTDITKNRDPCHCATPRGLIRDTTVWGDESILGINSIFHCATPRGLTTLYPPLAEGQAKLCPVLA